MKQFGDVTGQRFKRLTAVRPVTTHGKRGARWLMRCDCGTERVFYLSRVIANKLSSCGCANQRRKITFNGQTRTVSEWARELNLSTGALHHRLRHQPMEQALTEPVEATRENHRMPPHLVDRACQLVHRACRPNPARLIRRGA